MPDSVGTIITAPAGCRWTCKALPGPNGKVRLEWLSVDKEDRARRVTFGFVNADAVAVSELRRTFHEAEGGRPGSLVLRIRSVFIRRMRFEFDGAGRVLLEFGVGGRRGTPAEEVFAVRRIPQTMETFRRWLEVVERRLQEARSRTSQKDPTVAGDPDYPENDESFDAPQEAMQ